MKRLLFLVLALLLLAAPVAMADLTGNDIVRTTAGGNALTTGLGSPIGPSFIDLATDGSAWVRFIWFKDGCTSRAAADSATQWSRKLVVQLRDYTPPRSMYFPSGPDSVAVGLGTATEVIISR